MKKVFISDFSDKRMIYTSQMLKKLGYEIVNKYENCDFIVLPPKRKDDLNKYENIVDYLNYENFALKNAYLTAESALAIAINESEKSLINSKILVIGYGRIGKALHKYLAPFSNKITISARNSNQRSLAKINGANAIKITDLQLKNDNDFIFNTVPFPVLNNHEIDLVKQDALIIDLASFPGGVDNHYAEAKGVKVIKALGLPGKFSPKTAGDYVAETVDEMIREEII